MKKIISLILVLALACIPVFALSSCSDAIIVHTNAYFAPFEYYDGTEIKGVDVEIMELVGKKMGKDIRFENTEFSAIIDNVKDGKVCDAGAAGITVTPERAAKVDFSTPYYTSVQYVIMPVNSDIETKTVGGVTYVVWEALEDLRIGTQLDTTGWIYTDGEINATEDNDYGYDGVLYGTDTVHKAFDNAQLAADGIGSNIVDCVVIDELPAQFIVSKNSTLKCVPLYYSGAEGEADSPVEEQYAICVTKGNTELLAAINEVLSDLLVEDENGENGIQKLVMKHMGLED